MNRILVSLLVLVAVGYINADEPEKLGSPGNPEKIVGGGYAELGQFSYVVSIRLNHTHRCGGAILNSNHILTAYSCIQDQRISELSVVSGTSYLNLGGNFHDVADMYYVNGTGNTARDVAVLRLADNIDFNTYEEPIAIASSRPPSDVYGVVSGWGYYDPNLYTFSNRQRYLYVKIIDTLQCTNVYDGFITSEICTLNSAQQGACFGDRGDPLVYNNEVVGVLSLAYICAGGFPDIYTSVFDNLAFINQYINA